MALHQHLSPAHETSSHPTRRLGPGRPALILLLAAALSVGAMASHQPITAANGTPALVADGGSSASSTGPCWGCGG